MFTVEERDRVHERVLELAESDPRVVAGAAVGGMALGGGDRWSDIDLTFGVEGDVDGVLDDWKRVLGEEFDAVHLVDMPRGSSVYRVFLFPGCLQVDLSCTPAADFGARGPRFKLLFGEAMRNEQPGEAPAADSLGWAVHHAVRARIAIERRRFWHAEFWISWTRDEMLTYACAKRGLDTAYSRGFDELPADVLDSFAGSLVRELERDELLRALGSVIDALLDEAGDDGAAFEPRLRELS